jgi:hypothetical protein
MDESSEPFTITLEPTQRGFMRGDFIDLYGDACSIQESSLAGPAAIWLGNNVDRAHLSQAMAAALIPLLQEFVETGYVGRRAT